MDWVLIGGCLIAAWAVLSVVGGERQRLLNQLPPPSAEEPIELSSAPPAKH